LFQSPFFRDWAACVFLLSCVNEFVREREQARARIEFPNRAVYRNSAANGGSKRSMFASRSVSLRAPVYAHIAKILT
jgi:hypothetical protein